MDVVLDSNIYAADYHFAGAAFRALFDYLVRTEGRLVLPRIVREEVVRGFGRRLKKESKALFEVYRRYKLLDIHKDASFRHPNVRRAMIDLRKKLMKPTDDLKPIYIPETEGVKIDEVFMRGVHRTKPASEEGEELRDVIIWLWVCNYSSSKEKGDVSFVTQDSGFWSGDEPHQHIARDIGQLGGRLSIYRSIEELLKKHAPAPSEVNKEWFDERFKKETFESGATEAAVKQLSKSISGIVRDVHLDEVKFLKGLLYAVAPEIEFTELSLSLSFSFENVVSEHTSPILGGFFGGIGGGLSGFLSSRIGGGQSVVPALAGLGKPTLQMENMGDRETIRRLHATATANFSARLKQSKVAEVSLSKLDVDPTQLWKQIYRSSS